MDLSLIWYQECCGILNELECYMINVLRNNCRHTNMVLFFLRSTGFVADPKVALFADSVKCHS